MSGCAARKRERENPCFTCGHYHRYEEGEVCGICGHRMADGKPLAEMSAFPSEILQGFLYLGSYDNASRAEVLKAHGISRILNTVPTCQNLYKNSFVYYRLKDDKSLDFDDAIKFVEESEREKARVLVYCMSGKHRSPAIVIAYLMKCKGWKLTRSFQWVKERRPCVELPQAVQQQLQDYEQKLFGPNNSNTSHPAALPSVSPQSFDFGFPKNNNMVPVPAFSNSTARSIFDGPPFNPHEFTFGAGQPFDKDGDDISMDGS